jgi:peptide/nickel transport system substrate-binding protein
MRDAPTIASLTDPVVSIVAPSAEDLDHDPVGTGPFKFVEHEQGMSLTVTRNDDYWDGAVKFEGATFYYVSDPLTRSLMLEGDDVDIARGIPQSEYNEIEDKPDLEVLTKETLRTYFMYVNTMKAPLDDVRVRQAVNYCIDREEIVDTALEGVGGTPAKSVFPSILPWSANDELEGYTFNQAEALSLLEAAGITDTDGDGWLDYDT